MVQSALFSTGDIVQGCTLFLGQQLDLRSFRQGKCQLHRVANYWEAVGVKAALKQGIAPGSVRRPLADTMQLKQHEQLK